MAREREGSGRKPKRGRQDDCEKILDETEVEIASFSQPHIDFGKTNADETCVLTRKIGELVESKVCVFLLEPDGHGGLCYRADGNTSGTISAQPTAKTLVVALTMTGSAPGRRVIEITGEDDEDEEVLITTKQGVWFEIDPQV